MLVQPIISDCAANASCEASTSTSLIRTSGVKSLKERASSGRRAVNTSLTLSVRIGELSRALPGTGARLGRDQDMKQTDSRSGMVRRGPLRVRRTAPWSGATIPSCVKCQEGKTLPTADAGGSTVRMPQAAITWRQNLIPRIVYLQRSLSTALVLYAVLHRGIINR